MKLKIFIVSGNYQLINSSFFQNKFQLRLSFPDIKRFSRRNLYAIRQWYRFYSPDSEFVPQAVAQFLWGHNRLIIKKIKEVEEAIFYCRATIQNGWSGDNLELAQ